MSNIDYIEDVLLTVDNGKILKKKKSIIKPIVLLFVGSAILYFAGQHMSVAQNDMLSSVAIIIGLGILAWGIIAFIVHKEYYVYKPTGQMLKKHKVYVAANQSSQLYRIFGEDKYDDLQSINRVNQSNLSVEVFSTDDESYALAQVLEFVPYNDVPTSPVKVCVGTQAKQIAYFLK